MNPAASIDPLTVGHGPLVEAIHAVGRENTASPELHQAVGFEMVGTW